MWQIYRYEAGTHNGVAGVECSAGADGDSTSPDPDSLAPSWGAAETSWIALGVSENDGGYSAAPSGFTNLTSQEVGDTANDDGSMGTARKQDSSASLDPGPFTAEAEPWCTILVAVQPVAGGGGTEVVDLFPTADGTKTDVVDEGDATSDLYASIDDDPASPSDSDWNNNTDAAGEAFYQLTNMPSDFDEASAVTITVRYRGQNFGAGTVTLFARIYQSDESTALSDEVQVAQVTANGSFANTSEVTFTGVTASDKTTWDGARLRLRWALT
jgi:hypothetical protein